MLIGQYNDTFVKIDYIHIPIILIQHSVHSFLLLLDILQPSSSSSPGFYLSCFGASLHTKPSSCRKRMYVEINIRSVSMSYDRIRNGSVQMKGIECMVVFQSLSFAPLSCQWINYQQI